MNIETQQQGKGRPPARRRMALIEFQFTTPVTDIIMGGMHDAPGWAEYLSRQEPELRPYLRGVRDCIKGLGLVGRSADEICNMHAFEALDGRRRLAFTWRAWGDLMQAIVGKHEGYMMYYF